MFAAIFFAIQCLAALSAAGFLLAFYGSVMLMDNAEIDELRRQNRLVFENCAPPYVILRHWRTRPQAKRMLLFGAMSLALFVVARYTAA